MQVHPISPGRRRLVAGLALAALGGHARGQVPARPISLIVPGPAGGSSDTVGRVVAEALASILEVPVHVQNVAGDSGVLGTNVIATSPTDGSVLGLAVSGGIIGGKILSRSAQFNPVDDFTWFGILGTYPNAMVISSRSPHRTLDAWLETARRAPSPLVYASFGTGSAGHLAGAYLRQEAGANLVHLTLPTLDDGYRLLSEGKLDVLFDGTPNALLEVPHSGHQIVAVTSMHRVPSLPNVPSFGERWQQSFQIWIGLVAPKGLDQAAYLQLAPAVGVLMAEPRHADSLRAAGMSFLGLSGRGTRAFIENEFVRIAKLIAMLNDEGRRP